MFQSILFRMVYRLQPSDYCNMCHDELSSQYVVYMNVRLPMTCLKPSNFKVCTIISTLKLSNTYLPCPEILPSTEHACLLYKSCVISHYHTTELIATKLSTAGRIHFKSSLKLITQAFAFFNLPRSLAS